MAEAGADRPVDYDGGAMRSRVLARADTLITGDRQADYGDAQDSFGRIAALWSTYLGEQLREDLSAHQVATLMVLLKVSRSTENPLKGDSWTDMAGYAALGAELAGVESP